MSCNYMELRVMIIKGILGAILLTVAMTVGMTASGLGSGNAPLAERADCPGQITCPLTGQLVCRDYCPVGASLVVTEIEQASCCVLNNN